MKDYDENGNNCGGTDKALLIEVHKEGYRVMVTRIKNALLLNGYDPDGEEVEISTTDSGIGGNKMELPFTVFSAEGRKILVKHVEDVDFSWPSDYRYDAPNNTFYLQGEPTYIDNLDVFGSWVCDDFLPKKGLKQTETCMGG